MSTFFLICAAIGGTILALQLALALLGIGGEVAGDGGDLPDLPDGDGGDGPLGHEPGGVSDLAKKLTIQGVVSFVTFFGVGGLSAQGAGASGPGSVLAAVLAGSGATAALAYAFGALRKLQGSGSIRLANAVGEAGRVYLRVPGGNGGVGKVIVPIQGRSEEVRAVTSGPELRAGEAVIVVHAIDDRTLEVVSQAAYIDKAASLAD